MPTSSAISPNRGLVAIHSQPKDGSNNKRLMIKCYDSSVSVGTLKFTLSANLKDDSSSSGVKRLLFSSNESLLALLSNGKILVFDLRRGVHSQTVDSTGNGVEVCDFTSKENLVYVLVRKDGKSIVFVHDIEKGGKMIKKVKGGSCDEDDRLGVAVHNEDTIAVCIGNKIKIMKLENGETVSKCKIKSSDEGKISHGEKTCDLHFSFDGLILISCTPNGVHVFSVKGGERLGVLRISDVSSIQTYFVNKKYIATIVSNKSKASLVEIDLSNGKNKKIEPFATMTLPTSAKGDKTMINEAFFSSGKRAKSHITLLELAPRGMNNVDVSMTQVEYMNDSSQMQTGELYPKTSGKQDEKAGKLTSEKETSKKRKSASKNVVLGPGESGGEAMGLTDKSAKKRIKIDGDSDDDGDDFALEDDEAEESIAQKLALLSSELDRDTEDEEETMKIQNTVSNKFNIKGATTDSLVILLRQSLMANDDSQLEVALKVSDKRVIENSILGLANESSDEDSEEASGEIIIMLLTKLVTRLSRKPARAQTLAFWVRTVLVALISKIGSSEMEMGKAEKEIASRLGPLKNMLSDRVESLPELLRLEGRLSLLNSQL